MQKNNWYQVKNSDEIITPGLLVYPDRIKKNIESMISLSGSPNRLIPHVKTYKMKEIVKFQMSYGINEFKCATLGEMHMLISCKVKHILIAIQPTKEKIIKILEAQKKYRDIIFSTLVDNNFSLTLFAKLAAEQNEKLNLWVDINNGMNRTGIKPENAKNLCLELNNNSNLNFKGFHIYDGHIRPTDIGERIALCNKDFLEVENLIQEIKNEAITIPEIITGGTPSFYPHSLRKKNRLSPGTTLLWDLGYQKIWKEAPFLFSAILAIRLISIPDNNLLCFDLGHKAVASEMSFPRVEILGLEDAIHIGQSEEHLIVEYNKKNDFKIGDLFYAIPFHICPTVAKYKKAYIVKNGEIGTFWEIEARDYQYDA